MPRRTKTTQPAIDTGNFIARVRRYLHESGIQMTDLAGRAGVNDDVLSRLLSNPTRRPEPETIVALARAMDVSIWDLAVAAGYPFTAPGVPSHEVERLMRLLEADPELRDLLIRKYAMVSPEKRESVLQVLSAMLDASQKESPPPA